MIEINVPSLDKRKSDIPYLINHFLKDISKENQSKLKDIDEKAVLELQNFNWSGNVRELRNVVERLTVLSDSEII